MKSNNKLFCTRYGHLTVLYKLHNIHKMYKKYLCLCDCGNFTEVIHGNLTRGNTTSCGCERTKAITKHGYNRSRLYNIYDNMRRRCYKDTGRHSKYYKDKGITICDEWLYDKSTFFKWAIEHGYADNLTIDRIDNNNGYSPENCRWVSVKAQNRNTSRNIIVNYEGETMCLKDWCIKYGVNYKRALYRFHHGYTLADILNS